MMGQVGIPLFYLQELSGLRFRFKDNFADESQHWAWRLFKGELSEVGKEGVEQNGYYQLSVADTKDGRWDTDDNEAPRLIVGVPSVPCEIKTRLDYFTDIENSCAGLFITGGPTTFGGSHFFAIVRKHTATTDGIAVVETAQPLNGTAPITTLPVWLRIRLGCAAYCAINAYFDYSHDGVNWTTLWVQNTGWQFLNITSIATGIFVNNFSDFKAVTGRFDFFRIEPKSPN